MSSLGKEGCEAGSTVPSIGPESTLPRKTRLEGMLPRCVDEVQDALIEAHALERREPGGGRWPFAGDAPWHLMIREREAGDYGGEGQDGVSSEREPRPSLDTAEVARLAELRSWLELIHHVPDRKLVWIATGQLHAGEGRVPWKAIGKWLKLPVSRQAIMQRYRRALAEITVALNGWPSHWIKRLAA